MPGEPIATLLRDLAATEDNGLTAEMRRELAALPATAAPPQMLKAATRLGLALLAADEADTAQRLFVALQSHAPGEPPGWAGVARVATRRGEWAEAVALWDACIARFPAHPPADWARQRELALAGLQAGRPKPTPVSGAPVAAAKPPPAVIYGPRLDAAGTPIGTIQTLLRSNRLPEARRAYPAAVAAATDLAHLRALYIAIGALFEGWERTAALLGLRAVLAERARDLTPERARKVAFIDLRISLSLRDYAGFQRDYGRLTEAGPLAADDLMLAGIAARLRDRSFPDYQATKVFGIGLSKTGTTSFVAALEKLGFTTLHWTNPATGELFSDDDLFLFDGFADLPTCEHFEQYYYTFPNARFVYTTRPFESWKRSYLAQMKARDDASFPALKLKAMRADGVAWGHRNARLSFGMYYNYSSIAEAFDTYDRRVRAFFADKPADRFLEFSLSDGHGWPELCGFLGRPVPSEHYPRRNPQRADGTA